MKKLYSFYWNCGRQGSVEGLFIADEEVVAKAIGEEIDFGEILGKYSEIYGVLEEGDIEEVIVSDITIEEMEQVLGANISGYNPLNYITYTCSRCGDKDSPEYEVFWVDEDDAKVCDYCKDRDATKQIFKKI